MKNLPLIALALSILFASSALADDEPLVEIEGSAANQQRHDAGFELVEDGELTLTVACRENDRDHTSRFSVWFFEVEENGDLTEIERYRFRTTEDTPRTSATVRLPAGQYRMVVIAGRMDYRAKLEHKDD